MYCTSKHHCYPLIHIVAMHLYTIALCCIPKNVVIFINCPLYTPIHNGVRKGCEKQCKNSERVKNKENAKNGDNCLAWLKTMKTFFLLKNAEETVKRN